MLRPFHVLRFAQRLMRRCLRMLHLAIESKLPYMGDVDQYGQFGEMGQAAKNAILTPALCRAARGFLDWTQTDLAGRSGVSRSTIRDYEGSRHDLHRATEAQLRLAFEEGGVAFVHMEGGHFGVCPRAVQTRQ
jgi:DNA-binding XRE family transcriptional regulator